MGVTALVAPLTCRSLFRPGLRAAVGVGSVRVNRGFHLLVNGGVLMSIPTVPGIPPKPFPTSRSV